MENKNEELIRKKDAIDAMLGDKVEITNVIRALGNERDFEVLNCTCDRHAEIIKALPPVQPKRGKWVFKTVFPNDTSEFPMGYLVCSECGSKHSNKTPCNFCDNCGADMRGKADG